VRKNNASKLTELFAAHHTACGRHQWPTSWAYAHAYSCTQLASKHRQPKLSISHVFYDARVAYGGNKQASTYVLRPLPELTAALSGNAPCKSVMLAVVNIQWVKADATSPLQKPFANKL
jgi:hypothetical protein